MSGALTRTISDSLISLVKPIARFCVRRSLKLQDIVEALKVALLEVANEEMEKSGATPSTSKLSIMTGVHRRDVVRLLDEEKKERDDEGLLGRIIGQWRNDKRFCTVAGRPKVLESEGKESEFISLVRSVSKDVNPYAVLFELERVGAIERSKSGVKLRSQVFIPVGNVRQGLQLLASDAGDLYEGVEENIFHSPKVPNLHIKTEYDNISPEHEAEIREWLLREGTAFHQKARDFLSQYDRDINPKLADAPGSGRVAVGTFSLLKTN